MSVVAWQYRCMISNKHCVDFGEWQEWHFCDIQKFNEIKSLIESGYAYQVRELIVKHVNSDTESK